MRRFLLPLLGLLLAVPGAAQPPTFAGGGTTRVVPRLDAAALPTCNATNAGLIRAVIDGASTSDCSVGGGTDVVFCKCDGSAWGVFGTDPLTVLGPASVCADNQLARWDGASATQLQCSPLTVADTTGDITAPGALTIATAGSNGDITLDPNGSGQTVITDIGTAAAPALAFNNSKSSGFYLRGEGENILNLGLNGNPLIEWISSGVGTVGSFGAQLGPPVWVPKYLTVWEENLGNEAISIWSFAYSTPPALRIYAARDAATVANPLNYERVALSCDGSGNCTLAAETAGTGADDVDLHLKQAGAGVVTLGDGGTTNYVQVASDGHMTFAGTATYWDDVVVPGAMLRDVGAAAADFDQWGARPLYAYHFEAANDEELYGSIQMPHSWAGTSIDFHVHWTPETVSDGDPASQQVRWCIDYTWSEYDAVFPATTTATCGLGPSEEPVADKHYITAIGTLAPGTGADKGSSVLYFRIYRDANHADDDYEHEAILLSIDAHFEANRLGSNTSTPD